ncbi:hypothetical protein [Micromonospora halophytica]|uniref:Uncharacterized protein n=1 Tax=Micromonospora halophytica TaxID=47864 RepID=A0A1C5IM05_9ACTN|nr:hypothetical protein [Micromonospora halophytica]SCG59344.1 hypothetical protein GA0070560_113103 [Micromonospora halophytica]
MPAAGRRRTAGGLTAQRAHETNDLPRLPSFADNVRRVLRFDGVVTSCDHYLGTAARFAAHLGLPGAAPEAVDCAYRKGLARAAMHRAGVPSRRSR